MPRRSRPQTKLRRKPGARSLRKQIVIVCEGEKTEPNYYESMRQHLKLSTVDVVVIGGISDPRKLVERAIDERENFLYEDIDEVWCVFDKEQTGHNPRFNEAVKLARENKVNLGVTNPAFEFWYLLHYEYTDRPFENADKVIEKLKEHVPQYKKNMDMFQYIWKQTEDAANNAVKVKRNCTEDWGNHPNPSTTVHRSVKSILRLRRDIRAGKA